MTVRVTLLLSLLAATGAGLLLAEPATEHADQNESQPAAVASQERSPVDRSPVDLAITPDGERLVVANQTSGTASLVRISDGQVLSEVPCGQHPTAVAISADGKQALVTATYSGELVILAIEGDRLAPLGSVQLGYQPWGVAIDAAARFAYVALADANEVAVIDLEARRAIERIAVGQWPRYLCLSPDGSRLVVGCSGDGGISVVDVAARRKLYDSKFVGLNIGHLIADKSGQYAYFPWMVYADRPITPGNIKEGWVMGNRLARVRLDGQARREAIALDPRGKAIADPHGIALSPDEKWLLVSAAGTHELVGLALYDLPLRPDGPGDHMNGELAADGERLFRIPLGGRPLGMRCDATGQRAYVANYLKNAVQIVNLAERRLEREIPLGSAVEPSLARRGAAIFYDAHRSTDGWYSCHSCHYEGHINAVTMDTRNDGTNGTYKMVLSLRHADRTGPWFWHGWQNDLNAALARSLVETMQGPEPTEEEVRELAAFVGSLAPPPNSRSTPSPELAAQVQRGEQLFHSEAAACANCHSGPYLTDGQVHDVGLGSSYDKYQGFNTPSLVGIANRARYLHHGRALSLDDLLSDLHSPGKVSGTRELTAEERADLVAYLESL